ncbi:hypothetical protein [Dyella flagellata]|uniref:Uncharacterized protein n=1 Tax=Dyella flagellata TaxID=1867833 RepID=A0ABQ5XFA2_9GAMM|nr:hypothetical protein [Dyella flagellata]GLQ89119.1 hypothetical protein GCM10007898_26910 [Dyella flagellata]
MEKRSILFAALLLPMACRCVPALAGESGEHPVAPGIHEVGDDQLAGMRGRYIVGDNTVLWFGVEMVSTWQTNNGQTLQSTLTLGLDFSKNPNQPQVTFVPTVTITTVSNAPPVPAASSVSRSVQSAGIANVSGMTQSVQIAGDNNAAVNVTSLNIQNGSSAPPSSPSGSAPSSNATALTSTGTTPVATTDTGTRTPDGRVASASDASASATHTHDSAQVNLSVDGLGSASQWIRPGSLGQTIALTADNQVVTNQMIVSMVTQSTNATTSQLAHNLAQSLHMDRNR